MAPTQSQLAASKAAIKQPKARVARYLKSQEAKLVEKDAKSILLLKGTRCSDDMHTLLKDLRTISAPHAKLLNKNNPISSFEVDGRMSLEFLCTKNDCSLFALASHNKKRPNNLVLGRMFSHQILDMVELGVVNYVSLKDERVRGLPKKRVGSKPMILFVGDSWHLSEEMRNLQNLLLDVLRGEPVDKLALVGLDHVICITAAADGVIRLRTYYCKLKKNPDGGRSPVPYLTSSGPDIDFTVRRSDYASADMYKLARKQPKEARARNKKVKNKSTNIFGETIGRLHLDKQDIDKMQGKRSKTLRIAGKIQAEEERAALEEELQREKEEMGKEFRATMGFDEDSD